MSLETWEKADRPNYVTNVDLEYPYSELPYIPQYNLLRIPVGTSLLEHVDYWGEGRITEDGKDSGFRACFNVNRQFQEVSNGPDKYRKIPNRIPVKDEYDCDTRAYIKDNSVKLVTLMGAPIISKSAKDITRIVSDKSGMVVIYSKSLDSKEVKLLIDELKNKLIVYCPDYELSDYLKEPTLMDSHLVFLNETMIKAELFTHVSHGNYEQAINISKSLENDKVGFMITDLVDQLLRLRREPNVFGFANKLWNAGYHDLVEKYFPTEIKLITKEERVKIIGRYWKQALKLDANVDYYNDRLAWGDSKDQSSHRVSWKFVPVWKDNKLLFKMMNTEHTMYIKLDVNVDGYGDRKAWGSNNSNEERHLWRLTPVMITEGLVFLIENYQYNQSLKLDANVDSYGDRLLWGNSGSVEGNPEYFGWLIKAWP